MGGEEEQTGVIVFDFPNQVRLTERRKNIKYKLHELYKIYHQLSTTRCSVLVQAHGVCPRRDHSPGQHTTGKEPHVGAVKPVRGTWVGKLSKEGREGLRTEFRPLTPLL